MIKANELRIGNLVKYKYHIDAVSSIKAIDGDHVLINEQHESDYILHDDVEGIPLSEEILLKCGFFKGSGCHYTTNKDGFIFGVGKLDKPCDEYGWCFKYYNTDQLSDFFHSVHELQNLYRAICGQELNTAGL